MAELKVGAKAPQVKLVATDGTQFNLKNYQGKTVVLYFYPKDMTPGCTQEACDFRDAAPKFAKKGVLVVGISKDPVARHGKFTDKYGLNFPLLADEDGKVCKAYGVMKPKVLYGRKFIGIERSTFVIDPRGKIERIYKKVKVDGHVKDVLQNLTSL